MLTGIGLRNFKAFGDEMQEAPLSKITLIYGPNSGGKSSIIQALLLLKQSLEIDDYNLYDAYGHQYIRRTLVTRGEFVDLGSSQALTHRHETERELGLSVKYRYLELGDDAAENEVSLIFDPSSGQMSGINYKIYCDKSDIPLLEAAMYTLQEFSPTGYFAEVEVLQKRGGKEVVHFGEFLPTVVFAELIEERERELALERERGLERERELALERERGRGLVREQRRGWMRELVLERGLDRARARGLERGLDRAHGLALERGLDRALKPTREWEQKLNELDLLTEQILALTPENIPYDYGHHLRSINYLGPLRSAPERLYRRSPEIRVSSGVTGIQGENSVNVLDSSIPPLDYVNEFFEKFDIPYELDVRSLGEASLAGEYITIALYDKHTKTQVTLADVGYGINQVLPIIIEGVASQEGSILCVEQPEIHLHPRLQANIADLMIATISEYGKSKQWIVETHSELLMRRIQRRIREGRIRSDDVSVLYIDPDEKSTEGSAIKTLRLDEDGYFLDEWPSGFFDDGLKEHFPMYRQQMSAPVFDEIFSAVQADASDDVDQGNL